jgi:hypothetical protein
MDRVSSNIINNDILKEKEKQKNKIDKICDLVDCYIDNEISQNELTHRLMKLVDKPIIRISEMEWVVEEEKGEQKGTGNLYLCCRAVCLDGTRDEWCQVSDLTDFTVGEYNSLVEELNEHYPDYLIEYLEGRFV